MNGSPGFETLAIHAGQPPEPATGAVMVPIYQTSTFRQQAIGRHQGFEYSRTGNPTRQALEECLAALEVGARGLAFASGMAAADAVLHLLRPGDHILAVNDLYGGTVRLFEHGYAKFGVTFTYADPSDPGAFLAQLQPNTRLIWLETPTNPMLNLCDLPAILDGARRAASPPWTCVDNTFATPYLQQPIALGADLVLHSTTKYLGGHSDVIGGALISRSVELGERLAFIQNAAGAIPGPMDCFLVLRGIKTLPVRMDRHAANAQAVAQFLESHAKVTRVLYPGLASHPQHDLAVRQMRNAGGMVSFIPAGGPAVAHRIAQSTRVFALAESLGGVESLIEVPAAMTHASISGSPMAVEPALIRLSVGLETAKDLVDDLAQALDAAG